MRPASIAATLLITGCTPGDTIGKVSGAQTPPKEVNYDLWCGPAPKRPFNKRLHPGGWRQFLDYGNGQPVDFEYVKFH